MKQLFDTLDSNHDGLISHENIDISQLSNEMLDKLTGFLVRLENEKLELSFDQFYIDLNKEFKKVCPSIFKQMLNSFYRV